MSPDGLWAGARKSVKGTIVYRKIRYYSLGLMPPNPSLIFQKPIIVIRSS
jgi:hypothetical protein